MSRQKVKLCIYTRTTQVQIVVEFFCFFMLKFEGQHVAINPLDDTLNHSQNQLIILEQSQGDSGLEKNFPVGRNLQQATALEGSHLLGAVWVKKKHKNTTTTTKKVREIRAGPE